VAEDSRIHIQVLVDGLFHANALQWTWEVGRSLAEIANIPKNGLDDFVDSEGKRILEIKSTF
jgi:hypothetical protein